MTSLLVATFSHLLRYDLNERRTYVLENYRAAYYGLSWFVGSDRLVASHSGGMTVDLSNAQDYMRSENGFLSYGDVTSHAFLSNPHQIRCLDYPYIAATNTGRNALSIVNVTDWSVRQVWFDDVRWDRYDPSGCLGSHFNSIEFTGEAIHLLAHNFNFGSYELVLHWPSLEVVERRQYSAIQLHNLWLREDGMRIACDSSRGGLIDLSDERICWSSGSERSYTRGLACDGSTIFVGSSEQTSREDREETWSRIWMIERDSFKTLDLLDLGRFGTVQEVRLLDVPDDCHRVGVFRGVDKLVGHLWEPSTESHQGDRQETRDLLLASEAGTATRGVTSLELLQRERDEAKAHFERLERELRDRIAERDAGWSERDEVLAQYKRVSQEVLDRISERDAVTTERDRIAAELASARDQIAKLTRWLPWYRFNSPG